MQLNKQGLVQTCSAKAFQIVIQFAAVHDRHLVRDPGERDIGLRAAKLLERFRSNLGMPGHTGGGGEHLVGADEITTVTDGFARKPHRLGVVGARQTGRRRQCR